MILQYLTLMIVASVYLLDVKIFAVGEECIESNLTVKVVQGCPKTAAGWATAASKKGCSHIINNCGSFEYHCVTNAWQNETIEVCSRVINIVGNVCAEYSFGGRRIQRNKNAKCKACPAVYKSNESFKYSECYSQVYPRRETVRPIFINTSSSVYTTTKGITTTSSTLLAHIQAVPTSELQLASNINDTDAGNQKLESFHENAVFLGVSIPVALAVFILFLVLVVYKACKDKECSLKGIFSSLFKTKYEYQTPRHIDINVEDNGGKLQDERFTEEHPLTVDIV
ncbi:uncharacterized protein LOC125677557 [Ostrea edulis]|uniref:uncharacterized protein LOC125677557 n=1 Tax=Ostrea edulis TaxID=37623 RepID=UPI0024AEE54C|nr:uncharacterized protein LOC125677557 [Ostrea edulis]